MKASLSTPFVFSKLSQPKDIRDLLMKDGADDLCKLKQLLQWAVQLEFATIPPYLFALWSIRSQLNPVAQRIHDIVLQEMRHFGMTCNILSGLDGGRPEISSPLVVPQYPLTGLPGGVHPGLRVRLRRFRRRLILKTFMPIEEPQTGPIVWYGGETFPTIGTFYTEIQRLLREIQPTISMPRQVPFRDLSFPETELHAVDSVDAAIAEIEKIKVQGEGTSSSPLVEPGTDEYSHYARFGEIYWRHELEQVGPDRWSYTGPRIDYPEEIYPVARIPAEGYPESDEFNRTYTSMLNNLQNAWTTGGAAGTPFISHARTDMVQMRSLGVDLMRREITPGGKHFGPTFRLVSP